MSKIINCIQALQQPKKISEIKELFSLSWCEALELIGQIQNLDSELIKTNENNQYYLIKQLSWLDIKLIQEQLKKVKHDDYQVKIIPEVSSTNTYVLENLSQLTNKSVIVTELQTKGRGRANNKWFSRVGIDITVSFLYLFEEHYNFELFPLIVAVAINRLFKQYKVSNKIKWPNDIYQNQENKICGILVESGISSGKRFIVIGIGLDNIKYFERNDLLVNLIINLDNVIREYSNFGFAIFRREWLDNCIHFKQKVSIYQNNKLVCSGEHIDLTLDGALVINTTSGVKNFISSNVSLSFGGDK